VESTVPEGSCNVCREPNDSATFTLAG
jgi:hypothetical protein